MRGLRRVESTNNSHKKSMAEAMLINDETFIMMNQVTGAGLNTASWLCRPH